MPTYRYKAVDPSDCPMCGDEGFETMQPLSAAPLDVCPSCQVAIRRAIGPAATCVTERRWDEKKILSDDNLRAKGFKKLVKDGDGKYRNVLAD